MLSAGPAHAVAPSGMTRDVDQQAIDDVLEQQAAAWNRHDAHAWAEGFASDGSFTSAFGLTTRGRDAIESMQAGLFGDVLHDSSVTIVELDTRFAGGAAIVQARYALRGNPAVTDYAPSNGVYRCLAVLRKDFLAWTILAEQCGRQGS